MPTQKTHINGGGPEETESVEPSPQAEGDDLGLSENAGNIVDDPSGFVVNTPVETMHGRRVRPVPSSELERGHRMQAGDGVPMFGPSLTNKDGTPAEDQPKRVTARNPQQQAHPEARQKAESMMPSFMKEDAPPPAQNYAAPQRPADELQQQQQQQQQPATITAARQAMFTDSADMIRQLLDQEAAARNRGDYKGAAEARQMAEKIADGYEFNPVVNPRKEHPALLKLKASLGLEQIKPASIEWAGTKWSFAVTNARLDGWVAKNLRDGGVNIAALMISAGVVAIDDVPIYEFMSVPIVEDHTVRTVDDDGKVVDEQTVSVHLHRKFCVCGAQVNLEEKTCFSCHASLDPSNIPTDLRLVCAERFNKFLEEEFGPYEELAVLFEKKVALMKDRQIHKEELFPLAMSSQEAVTTTSSQSGDES